MVILGVCTSHAALKERPQLPQLSSCWYFCSISVWSCDKSQTLAGLDLGAGVMRDDYLFLCDRSSTEHYPGADSKHSTPPAQLKPGLILLLMIPQI